jgi:uncharacterized protein with PIN domain
MILDTSALVAVLFGEPEADSYTQLIHSAGQASSSSLSPLSRRTLHAKLSTILEKDVTLRG